MNAAQVPLSRRVSRATLPSMWNARFQADADTLVECEWSPLGLETYKVNGREVLSMRSAAPNVTRSFVAGPNQRKVEVRIQTSPATPVDPTNWVAEAWVDGRLLVADLTPDLRGKARAVNRVLNWGIVVVLLLILAATLYRWVL